MSGIHKSIFPYVDFATFTMDKLLRGPQGGVLIYRTLYEKAINASIFPKTQGGPMQHNMFAKAMCFLKLQIATFCGHQGHIRRTAKNTPRTLTIMPRKVLYMSST